MNLSFLSAGLAAAVLAASGATLFQDGFEDGAGAAWQFSSTGNGRERVLSDFEPFAGTKHLVLDDSVDDALFSSAEATATVNLVSRKNVVLSFRAKSIGNEPNNPGQDLRTRAFDGVSVSSDGGTTWRLVQSLANVPVTWQLYTVSLDQSALVAPFVSNYKIRFSAYDNAGAPLDGIAIDEVVVTGDIDQRAVLELPPLVDEGGGPHTGVAMVAIAPESPLTLALQSIPQGQLTAPSTITIPAGQTTAAFQFSVADDTLLNFSRTASLAVSGTGIPSSTTALTVVDNETAKLTLTLPSRVMEGAQQVTAKVSIDKTATAPLLVRLVATPADEIVLPETVTIPAGAKEVTFFLSARDDERIDGSIDVTVSASATGLTSVTSKTTADDDEVRQLSINLPPYVSESGSVFGSIRLSGTLAAPVSVTLQKEGPIAIAHTVTIPAGALAADFLILGVNNSVRDGSRNGVITATVENFDGVTAVITVRDDEKAGFRFTETPQIAVIGAAATFSVAAVDIEGNVIEQTSGNTDINLQAVLPDGSLASVNPSTATLVNGVWRGSVTIPNVGEAPLRLRASDNSGNTNDSAPFDLLREVSVQAADLAWDAKRGRIYASIPANATSRANTVVAIDPATGEITGSVAVSPDPRQLAITSGQEYLYVALDGSGSIARIKLDTFTVNSTFEIGASPFYGTLYAEDIAAVEGKPNLIVVSRYRRSVSPRHGGVAVFDNGVQLPDTTQDHTGSNIIEPSADSNIFFGYNTETTEFGFRKLQLDANGIREIQVVSGLFSGFGATMKSDGDFVVGGGGDLLNGAQMRKFGNFGTSGVACPDFAINRVFFLEPTQFFGSEPKLSAYDPITFTRIRQLAVPNQHVNASALIRWGKNGLGFRSDTGVSLIYSGLLVPSEDPADLGVSVAISPNPATVGQSITYTVTATNLGPNAAENAIVSVSLSDGEAIQSATASVGSASISGNTVTFTVPSIVTNGTATLTIVATPQSAGGVSAQAGITSTALDPVSSNNTAVKVGSVGFQLGLDTVNYLRLPANAMTYDPTRGLLWVSVPASNQGPLARTVLSVNPLTGLVSDPISFTGNPSTLAVSRNGHYLYIGLSDSPEVQRIDLETRQADLRVPLGTDSFLGPYYAEDIEPLDGDGTSILVSRRNVGYSPRHEGVAVYDGVTQRPNTTQGHTGSNRIEATASPDLFIGYNNETTEFGLRTLAVDASGVRETRVIGGILNSFYLDIRSGRSDLVLSSGGQLVNGPMLTLKANLGVSGFPAVDGPNKRAFILTQNQIRAHDTESYNFVGALPLSAPAYDGQASEFIRWGSDGFAILSASGRIAIARWSLPFPNPVGPMLEVHELSTGGGLKLVATEQVVTGAQAYKVYGSADLQTWTELLANECQTSTLDTYSENGIQFQTVQYSVPTSPVGLRFFRLGRATP